MTEPGSSYGQPQSTLRNIPSSPCFTLASSGNPVLTRPLIYASSLVARRAALRGCHLHQLCRARNSGRLTVANCRDCCGRQTFRLLRAPLPGGSGLTLDCANCEEVPMASAAGALCRCVGFDTLTVVSVVALKNDLCPRFALNPQ